MHDCWKHVHLCSEEASHSLVVPAGKFMEYEFITYRLYQIIQLWCIAALEGPKVFKEAA